MSAEMFENDLSAFGMLPHGEANAFTEIHNALDYHCPKHTGSHGIVSIGMGKLPGEHEEAFRLRFAFADETKAFNYAQTHKDPTEVPSAITLGLGDFWVMNVGQARMGYLLTECGASPALIQKALDQYKKCPRK